ncbi:CHAT domain-containing protein [Tahibacter soli]|uniref:CHAT domain-containing protein n=1 Tax=Tahibacter soli TaxID=2983605 RepID=A0A9X3YIG2_9GAMM|nr:CHAT domain-containing protein [Tahibacter soli]MDC8012227.1 CHAT domain-containing protein [Tahibacter soli]
MRRVVWFFVGLSFAAAASAADIAGRVGVLLAPEKYADAKAIVVAALADPRTHDAALPVAFNLVVESARDFGEDEWTPWVAELERVRVAKGGDDARSLAPIAAWRAEVAWRKQDADGANAQLARVRTLLDAGRGAIDPAERAYALSVLAQIGGMQGGYAQAQAAAKTAVDTLAAPRTPLERARRLRALYFYALFQDRQGEYAGALATARTGIAEAEAFGGSTNGYRRRLVGALTESLISIGEFAQVRDLMRPELERLRAQPQPSPREMAMTLGHLAEAQRQLGDREGALALYRESAQNAAKDPGLVASGSYAAIVGNLGALAYDLRRYDEADAAMAQNLALLEEKFGPDSARVVPPLTNAGEVALERGLVDDADARFRRALAIVATQLGPEHPDGAPALRGLARVALARGDAAGARKLLDGALAQRSASIGENHPELLTWRCERARAALAAGDPDAAFADALVVEATRTRLVATVAPVLGETQALEFKRGLATCAAPLLAIAAQRNDAATTAAAWREIAAARGLATHIGAARLAAARQAATAEQKASWDAWSRAAQDYAKALREGAPAQVLDALRASVDAAVEKLGTSAGTTRPPLAALLAAMPDGGRLVAYVATPPAPNEKSKLYAFVAAAGAAPRLVDLGDEAALDALAQRWQGLVVDAHSDAAALREAGAALRRRVFDPLSLAPSGRTFVVADGGLHRLNFAALPDGDGYLIERGLRMHTLETEHDLAPARSPDAGSVLLVGAPRFARETPALARLRGACPELDALAPLPGAAREIAALSRLARDAGRGGVKTLTGDAATSAALRDSIAGADTIHFATHALELGAGCVPALAQGRRGVGVRRADTDRAADAKTALASEAGLVLAGDGLLTSAQVATMPLDRARWVVLSACDTGLGRRLGDEGVFGLRRAFRLAGARTVVMSLWPVDDAATAGWMEALYTSRFMDKADTVDAMAAASLATLAARRERGETAHPFYWAGFVASGDWR